MKPPQPFGLWEAVGYTDSNTAHFKADSAREGAPPQPLHVLEADLAAAADDHVRRPLARGLPGAPRANQHAASGAAALERAAVHRGGARHWPSGRLREGGSTEDDRLTYMHRLVMARPPDAKDLSELSLDSQGPDGPLHEPARRRQAVARNGRDHGPDPRYSPAELAAWTMIANVILNLDEAISKG